MQMKTIGRLTWCWISLWAWLGQPAFGDPGNLPRAMLSVQKTPPPTMPQKEKEDQPAPIDTKDDATVPDFGLTTETMAVDLATVLRLAGVDNPQVLLARERVLEAVAQR